jgi:ubiquinone/menaquinone biosynthesis C-methylase UbiE
MAKFTYGDIKMTREYFLSLLKTICILELSNEGINNFQFLSKSFSSNQQQTNEAFSDKWSVYNKSTEKEKYYQLQKDWYLKLYGFSSENELTEFLKKNKIILDAGCGLGFKAAWFAELSPESLVIGMDFSDVVNQAAEYYAKLPNLFFIQGDIAETNLLDNSVDYVSCDQVIMHTANPDKTFAELSRITALDRGQFSCYFYAKKALPRELLDNYFRSQCINMSKDDLWQMSEQLALLGKRLSELEVSFEAPDIPALGIKGGKYDVQRFIYWNFIKCFWNQDLGYDTSVMTNYDWYSPSNAKRFTQNEIMDLISSNGLSLVYFHIEEACYSGRFSKATSILK